MKTKKEYREYQARYYQLHKEKAKEYQRQYQLAHKRKRSGRHGSARFARPCEVIKHTFKSSDIIHAPAEKAVRMIEQILSGHRLFVR